MRVDCILTPLYAQMDSSLFNMFNTMNLRLSIVSIEGSQVIISKYFFLPLKIVFVLANGVDPDEMPHYVAFHLGFHCLPKYTPSCIGQLVMCLTADKCLTADPVVASSILTQSHTFVEIDHEIISMAILLHSANSRRVVVSYTRKYVHEVLVNHLVKLAQEKSVVRQGLFSREIVRDLLIFLPKISLKFA